MASFFESSLQTTLAHWLTHATTQTTHKTHACPQTNFAKHQHFESPLLSAFSQHKFCSLRMASFSTRITQRKQSANDPGTLADSRDNTNVTQNPARVRKTTSQKTHFEYSTTVWRKPRMFCANLNKTCATNRQFTECKDNSLFSLEYNQTSYFSLIPLVSCIPQKRPLLAAPLSHKHGCVCQVQRYTTDMKVVLNMFTHLHKLALPECYSK